MGQKLELDVAALRRRTWTEREARMVLSKAADSGLSLAAFARKHGLCAQRLYWWRDRVGRPSAARLVPVTVLSPPAVRDVGAACTTVEVRTPSGFVVRVPPGADVQDVATALRAIKAASC